MKTASQQIESDSADTNSFISFLRGFLLAFGGIALFVGSFVIANSLSITIAQRTRELATLRTLGASRRQVLRSIIIEALVVGTLASLVGLFFGLVLAKVLFWVFDLVGLHPSEHRARVPHALVRDRGARGRNPRDADREPAPCDPGDSRPSDRGRARGLGSPASQTPAPSRRGRGAHGRRRDCGDRLRHLRSRPRDEAGVDLDGCRDAAHVHRGLALLVAARPSPGRRSRLARDQGPPARRGCSPGTTRVATRSGQRRLQPR